MMLIGYNKIMMVMDKKGMGKGCGCGLVLVLIRSIK